MPTYDLNKLNAEIKQYFEEKGILTKDGKAPFNMYIKEVQRRVSITRPSTLKRYYTLMVELDYIKRDGDYIIFLER